MSDFHRMKKHPEVKWVMSRKDLPRNRMPARYKVTRPDGTVVEKTFSKRKRQTIELLCQSKVFCASPVRISQHVCLLKHEDNIDIFTESHKDKNNDEHGKYGIYRLEDKVEYLGEVGLADG